MIRPILIIALFSLLLGSLSGYAEEAEKGKEAFREFESYKIGATTFAKGFVEINQYKKIGTALLNREYETPEAFVEDLNQRIKLPVDRIHVLSPVVEERIHLRRRGNSFMMVESEKNKAIQDQYSTFLSIIEDNPDKLFYVDYILNSAGGNIAQFFIPLKIEGDEVLRFFVTESLSSAFFNHFIQTQKLKEHSNLIVFSEEGDLQYVYDTSVSSAFYNYNSTYPMKETAFLQMINLMGTHKTGKRQITAFFDHPLSMHHYYFNWYEEARVGGDACRVLYYFDTPVYPQAKEPLTSMWREVSEKEENNETHFSIALIQDRNRWKLLLPLKEETVFVKGSILNGSLVSQKILQSKGEVMLLNLHGSYDDQTDLLKIKLTWENHGRHAVQSYLLDRVPTVDSFPRKQNVQKIDFRF